MELALSDYLVILENGYEIVEPIAGALFFLAGLWLVNQILKWVKAIVGLERAVDSENENTDYRSMG